MRDKNMSIKGILTIVVVCLFTTAMAQSPGPGLTVTTNPPGAEVEVAGALVVRGMSPVTFSQGLQGDFDIKIKKAGYETYKSSLFLSTANRAQLDVNLTAKTKFKAALRSVFIPGWGQAYANQKTKGVTFMILAAGSAAAYLLADKKFDDKRDEYDDYMDRYNSADTYAEKANLYPLLQNARQEAYDAENVRRITIGTTVAIWSLSVLDALLFFPEQKGSLLVDQIAFEPNLLNGGGQIILSHNF